MTTYDPHFLTGETGERSVISWRRHIEAERMRELGFVYREIGERLGVTPARARDMVEKMKRRRRYKQMLSPLERYHNHADATVAVMTPTERRKLAFFLIQFGLVTKR